MATGGGGTWSRVRRIVRAMNAYIRQYALPLVDDVRRNDPSVRSVERTLTGRVTVFTDSANSALDPIVTGGGVPISGARVTVSGPDGATATAIEARILRGNAGPPEGTGVYRFLNSAPGAGRAHAGRPPTGWPTPRTRSSTSPPPLCRTAP